MDRGNGADLPPDIALLLGRLTGGLATRGGLVGVYVYGSLATGDFSPARSDIDVVVMLEREPDQAAIGELEQLHKELASLGGAAGQLRAVGQLHCLYVPVESEPDPERLHAYWYGDRMTQWQLKVMTQAELATDGVAFHGPWPPPGIRPVPIADVQAAVREEVRGYWRRIARRRKLWLQDDWVDHGLIVLPRAEAVLAAGDLITKTEAIGRLTADFGVPAALAGESAAAGKASRSSSGAAAKLRRARLARRIMRRGVRRLSRLDPVSPRQGD